ncbi:NAD-dependent deacetylase [Halieaceae bacterium IMCC14734]|uniref:protein acetyllysine N-acetyltransferase n=1 Tax=Candidatus Litorirhabdus singularis TaxID=2518993 RepID=A0ABT3TCT2_9GAMM|nr:Sir2 family NAD-dependent protein deacetylase [Candidatus Litorirhabdus singularis]MCX2980113.1 NAD-dependent deacetylase [Candidatus Litorirhabdus singularis]
MASIASPDQLEQLNTLLQNSQQTVVFTGAGISTESGIPDFRSPGGLWSKNQPIDFGDFIRSADMRRESWRRKFNMDPTLLQARPNTGHEVIAEWVKAGKVSSVITQNVDGLHQAAGVPDEQVIELHGNTTYAHCLDCGLRHELDTIRQEFMLDESLPLCAKCGGIVKTATISFGQSMPETPMLRAESETHQCDLFIAIGSSLVVYPAAGFPIMAQRNGSTLVILNREATELDPLADLVLNAEIGPTLAQITISTAH